MSDLGQKLKSNRPAPSSALTSTADITHRGCEVRKPSLVYDTGNDVPAHALILDYHEENGAALSVEVFPRANGNTLVTAFSDQTLLPFDPATVTPEPGEIDRLQAICERLSPMFRADRIIARQACLRPMTQDALPLIGKVPSVEGATGHGAQI
jgi:glycine/D-amino acid oxidase-like deaminating enzyme